MWGELYKWLDQHYHVFTFFLAGVVTTWVIADRYYKWAGRLKKTESDCSKIDTYILPELGTLTHSINAIKASIHSINNTILLITARLDAMTIKFDAVTTRLDVMQNSIDSMNSSLGSLKDSFNRLVVYLKGKDDQMDISLFFAKSPIELTERILITMGGKRFVDNNLRNLINEMNAYEIKTALDAQAYAPFVIDKESVNDSFKEIKDYAFENPYFKGKNLQGEEISVPMNMGTITHVMGIYLRNKYLQFFPGLRPKEINN